MGTITRTTTLTTLFAFTAALRPPALEARTQTPEPTRQTVLQIEHDPLACLTVVLAPLVDARVNPGPDVARSYVYFRASGTPYFYYAIMAGAPPDLTANLPRPLPETKSVDYYVQATDRIALSRKTPQYVPIVVPENVCSGKGLLVGPEGAALTIGLTDARQPPVPPGFNKKDIARVILVTGVIVTLAVALEMSAGTGAAASGAGATGSSGSPIGTGASAGAATGGGVSTGVLVAGGVAVAAGAAVVISKSQSKSSSPSLVTNHFIEGDVTWSGTGFVDIQLLNPSGQSVGTPIPVTDCSLTVSRTARVLLQGSNLAAGSYQVRLTGRTCGAGTPPTITALLTVQTDAGQKCSAQIIAVPVGSTVPGCSFTLP